jgi:aspartokinase-like uncharacterized kinase
MERDKRSPAAVIKVGGSLFDVPDLGPRLRNWLAARSTGEIILVAGGGPAADVVRQYDRLHALGEEVAHWLALSALTLNARFLAALLPRAAIVPHPQGCAALWLQKQIPILDPFAFACADEGQPGCLPHRWTVTSDALAARVARVAGADELILLKSIALPADMDWIEAGKRGLVDSYFATAAGSSLPVRFIHFRP